MVATHVKKIMHNMICVTGMCSVKMINLFFVSQMSLLVGNFNSGIYSDTIKNTHDKCQTLHGCATHSALLFHTTFSDLHHVSRSKHC